ncbi:ComF family protein [Actinomyces bowdenii]|nr:phosphoribosyltransferase family protein [Actinomyces bowdenii]
MDESPDGDTDGAADGAPAHERRAGAPGPRAGPHRMLSLGAGLAQGLLGLGLPASCAGCGRWETALCPQCRGLLEAGALLVEHAEAAGDLEILAAATYAGPVRNLVLGWKNGAREDLDEAISGIGRGLGRAWASHQAERMARSAASPPAPPAGDGAVRTAAAASGRGGTADEAAEQGSAAAAPPLLVIPAPSGAGRRLRGRLVAARLADAVARGIAEHGAAAGGPAQRVLSADVLRRRGRAGAHQAGRSAHQRRANRSRAPRVLAEVRGLPAVLVDDVVTTGATLESCVRALEGAGARVLGAVVLAATPPPGGGSAGAGRRR